MFNSFQLVVEAKNQHVFNGQIPIAVMAFFTAFIASLIWAWLSKKSPLPTWSEFQSADWYLSLGGVIRVAYLICIVTAMTVISPGKTFSISIAAQLITMVLIDHFGLLGVSPQKVDLQKLLGCSMVMMGAFLVMVPKLRTLTGAVIPSLSH